MASQEEQRRSSILKSRSEGTVTEDLNFEEEARHGDSRGPRITFSERDEVREYEKYSSRGSGSTAQSWEFNQTIQCINSPEDQEETREVEVSGAVGVQSPDAASSADMPLSPVTAEMESMSICSQSTHNEFNNEDEHEHFVSFETWDDEDMSVSVAPIQNVPSTPEDMSIYHRSPNVTPSPPENERSLRMPDGADMSLSPASPPAAAERTMPRDTTTPPQPAPRPGKTVLHFEKHDPATFPDSFGFKTTQKRHSEPQAGQPRISFGPFASAKSPKRFRFSVGGERSRRRLIFPVDTAEKATQTSPTPAKSTRDIGVSCDINSQQQHETKDMADAITMTSPVAVESVAVERVLSLVENSTAAVIEESSRDTTEDWNVKTQESQSDAPITNAEDATSMPNFGATKTVSRDQPKQIEAVTESPPLFRDPDEVSKTRVSETNRSSASEKEEPASAPMDMPTSPAAAAELEDMSICNKSFNENHKKRLVPSDNQEDMSVSVRVSPVVNVPSTSDMSIYQRVQNITRRPANDAAATASDTLPPMPVFPRAGRTILFFGKHDPSKPQDILGIKTKNLERWESQRGATMSNAGDAPPTPLAAKTVSFDLPDKNVEPKSSPLLCDQNEDELSKILVSETETESSPESEEETPPTVIPESPPLNTSNPTSPASTPTSGAIPSSPEILSPASHSSDGILLETIDYPPFTQTARATPPPEQPSTSAGSSRSLIPSESVGTTGNMDSAFVLAGETQDSETFENDTETEQIISDDSGLSADFVEMRNQLLENAAKNLGVMDKMRYIFKIFQRLTHLPEEEWQKMLAIEPIKNHLGGMVKSLEVARSSFHDPDPLWQAHLRRQQARAEGKMSPLKKNREI